MGEIAAAIGVSFLAVACFMMIVFMAAAKLGRYDLIDAAWGPAFLVVAIMNLLRAVRPSWAAWLVTGLVAVWAARLSWHILDRIMKSEHEDPRYVDMRKNWPKRYRKLQMFGRVYLVQAALVCVIALPVVVIIHSPGLMPGLGLAGALVWLAGFGLEAVADWQLKRFLADDSNRGKLMTRGLWRLSRHPNYFGEVTQWWGIGIMALGGATYGLWGLVGPLTLTLLICFVSGVPLAERRAEGKLGWEPYKRRTRMLIPLPK